MASPPPGSVAYPQEAVPNVWHNLRARFWHTGGPGAFFRLQQATNNTPALRMGHPGNGQSRNAIAVLQRVLILMQVFEPRLPTAVCPTGRFDALTDGAVRIFQRQNPVFPVDGWAGGRTMLALDERLLAIEARHSQAEMTRALLPILRFCGIGR
jgi:hypothetical protein